MTRREMHCENVKRIQSSEPPWGHVSSEVLLRLESNAPVAVTCKPCLMKRSHSSLSSLSMPFLPAPPHGSITTPFPHPSKTLFSFFLQSRYIPAREARLAVFV